MRIFIFFALYCIGLNAGDLHRAIKRGQEVEAQLLIESIARPEDLNILDREGFAPIHLAIIHNFLNILKLLHTAGADFTVASIHGETPIILAFRVKNYAALKKLQKRGFQLESNIFYKFLRGKQNTKKPLKYKRIPDRHNLFFEMLHNKNRHNFMIYTYAIFYSDAEFFETLIQLSRLDTKNNPLICNLLRELALEGFPPGLMTISNLKKLHQLMTEVNSANHLRLKLWNTIEQLGQQKEPHAYNRPLRALSLRDTNFEPELVAEAITELSESLLRAVSIKEVIAWLIDHNDGPSIQAMGQFSRRIINWFAYQVAMEPNAIIRAHLVEKLIQIGHEFSKLNNYWGIAQIISVLNRTDIMRLKCCNYKRKIALEINKLTELIDTKNNYGLYRSTILTQSEAKNIFPNIDIIFADLKKIFEEGKDIQKINWIQQISIMFKSFKDLRKQGVIVNTNNKLLSAYFSHLPIIPDEVIEAYSNLQIPWPFFNNRTLRWQDKQLDSWDCYDLYSYLEAKKLSPCFPALLEAGLWDGMKIYEHLYSMNISSTERVNFLIENGIPSDLASSLEMNLFLAR